MSSNFFVIESYELRFEQLFGLYLKTSNPNEFLKNLLSVKSYRSFSETFIWSWTDLLNPIVTERRYAHKNDDISFQERDFSNKISDLYSTDQGVSYEASFIFALVHFFTIKNENSIYNGDILVVKWKISCICSFTGEIYIYISGWFK